MGLLRSWPVGGAPPGRGGGACHHRAMSTTSGAYPLGTEEPSVIVRQALPSDARRIYDLVAPYAEQRILITKELITYFEAIQEFLVAELPGPDGTWEVVGCGALHVLWDDIAEVRTLAVDVDHQRRGVGRHVLVALLERARALGLQRVFCLTFEVDFFQR